MIASRRPDLEKVRDAFAARYLPRRHNRLDGDRLRLELKVHDLDCLVAGQDPGAQSSGKQQRHRLNRGGDRQANAALSRIVVVGCAGISRPRTT